MGLHLCPCGYKKVSKIERDHGQIGKSGAPSGRALDFSSSWLYSTRGVQGQSFTVMLITSFTLPSCEHQVQHPILGKRLLQSPGTQIGCNMNPLQSGQILSSSLPSEQVTPSVRPALVLSEQRGSIPPVVVIRPALVGDECVRPALLIDGFEQSRLLLERLEVLAAALQQSKNLDARRPMHQGEGDEGFLNDPFN
jgi:hypothetical protein